MSKIEKLFKFSVAVSILFCGIAIFYYFVIFLPKQKMMDRESKLSAEYRNECIAEIDDKYQTVTQLSTLATDSEQAKNIAIHAGIADEKYGYLIDKDILIKECVEQKQRIYGRP